MQVLIFKKKNLSQKKKMPFWLYILQHDLEHIKQEICYAYFKNLSNFTFTFFNADLTFNVELLWVVKINKNKYCMQQKENDEKQFSGFNHCFL